MLWSSSTFPRRQSVATTHVKATETWRLVCWRSALAVLNRSQILQLSKSFQNITFTESWWTPDHHTYAKDTVEAAVRKVVEEDVTGSGACISEASGLGPPRYLDCVGSLGSLGGAPPSHRKRRRRHTHHVRCRSRVPSRRCWQGGLRCPQRRHSNPSDRRIDATLEQLQVYQRRSALATGTDAILKLAEPMPGIAGSALPSLLLQRPDYRLASRWGGWRIAMTTTTGSARIRCSTPAARCPSLVSPPASPKQLHLPVARIAPRGS